MTDESSKSPGPDDFDARLRAARARENVVSKRVESQDGAARTGMGLGFRIAIELVAGVAVGTGIGYVLDRAFGSRPWLMVVFFFLGAAAGVLNVYRAAKGLDDSVGLGAAQRRRDQDRLNGS